MRIAAAGILLIALLPALLVGGCAGGSRIATDATSPYSSAKPGARDPMRAQALTLEAADLMESDPGRAEELLRAALGADLWHGPAHNNLGVLHLRQGRLYEAAGEFEWARRLMPGHPDPRMNLAFVLEKAGRVDEALATYGTALEVYAGHLPTVQAMARLAVREGVPDERLEGWLRDIALRGETEEWRGWALAELSRRGG